MLRRIAALPRAVRLHAEVESARRREARALVAAGEAACASRALGQGPEVARAVADAAALRERRDATRRAAAASFEQDRTDWAGASSGLKVLVLVRGWLVRAVLAAQRRRIERELAPLLGTIGAHALASPEAAATLPASLAAGVEQERARAERAAAERARLLEPLGGHALPPAVGAGLREASRVALGVGRELRSRLVPRLPGLVGLAAGWGVAQSFTASRWAGVAERLGLRDGGPWVVSPETYERLESWVPLVAAALCAYLGSQLWARVERRYGTAAPEGRIPGPVSPEP